VALRRRAVLAAMAAVAGGVLAGCGAGEPEPGSGIPDSAGLPATSTPAAPGSPRDRILARYRGMAPTRWGMDLPGIVTRLPTSNRVAALTFDACGGPHGSGYDATLINTLRTNRVPATLFLNSRWIDANPGPFAELAADPLFEIGNHGTRHVPLSVSGRSAYDIPGTRDPGEVVDEVAGNRDKLAHLLGKPPRLFRSGTAHYDDVAVRILADLATQPVGFDINGDAGATLPAPAVKHALMGIHPGSIVICHLNHPEGGTATGLAKAVPRLLDSGLRFAHVSEFLT
jgi:peptidoglycan/xylan/chitin deacetylase (PgdA/CDA1 family)